MTRVVLHINTLHLQGGADLGVVEREALVAAFVQTLRSQLRAHMAEPGAAGQLATQGHRERVRLSMAPATAPTGPASHSPVAAQGSATGRGTEWGARAATSLCTGLLR